MKLHYKYKNEHYIFFVFPSTKFNFVINFFLEFNFLHTGITSFFQKDLQSKSENTKIRKLKARCIKIAINL